MLSSTNKVSEVLKNYFMLLGSKSLQGKDSIYHALCKILLDFHSWATSYLIIELSLSKTCMECTKNNGVFIHKLQCG